MLTLMKLVDVQPAETDPWTQLTTIDVVVERHDGEQQKVRVSFDFDGVAVCDTPDWALRVWVESQLHLFDLALKEWTRFCAEEDQT